MLRWSGPVGLSRDSGAGRGPFPVVGKVPGIIIVCRASLDPEAGCHPLMIRGNNIWCRGQIDFGFW